MPHRQCLAIRPQIDQILGVDCTVLRPPARWNAPMFDVIERLKSEWTDRYVVIDSPAPELARFAHATGTVKTVNMNGRCLVEFDQFNNTGWYDIDPACLKIVPQPLPKPAEVKPAVKETAAKPVAAAKPAAGAAAGAKPARQSTADILAAARAKAGGAPAQPSAKAASPAAEKKSAPATADGGKPSTAEILARARAAKSAAPSQNTTPPETVDEAEPVVAEPAPAKKLAAGKKPASAGGAVPTTTAEKISWCRQHDAQA